MAKHQNLIQNYGLFWDRDNVDWSAHKATLYGYVKAKDAAVDFRDQVGIYALYDTEFRLLYVGQAGRGRSTLFNRLRLHNALRRNTRALAARWRYFSWFGLLRVLKKDNALADAAGGKLTTRADILDALEAVVIEIAGTELNRQGGQLGGAREYLQYTEGAVASASD